MELSTFLALIQLITGVITDLFNAMDEIIIISTSPSWSLLDFEIVIMIYMELQVLVEELTH